MRGGLIIVFLRQNISTKRGTSTSRFSKFSADSAREFIVQFLDNKSLSLIIIRDASDNGRAVMNILRDHFHYVGSSYFICAF